MRILVTGGAGFIGSHLCDALIQANHEVIVVDNLILGKMENINHLMKLPNFHFYKEDILNFEGLKQIFNKHAFDMVFHMAANSDIQKGSADPEIDFNLTFKTTFNVLQCLKEFNVKKLFFASTSAIYGETSDLLTEDYGPLRPVSNYGAGKLASEAFISAFSAAYDIQTWITRFPNVVGERFTHGVIYDFIHKLKSNPNELEVLGNGEQNKPYLYVKDLIEGILFVCNNSHERFNVYNLGSNTRTKVKEIAKMVIEEMGLNARINYTGGDRGWVGDVPEFKYDVSKINQLGWKAKYTSNESVRLAIQKALGK
ncbi:MAG TPA: NAD-dependent epimerase/dehydratase family protein [Paludibacteraceae bacterium]|nr:NAD-dependent epimerase/dehydratase family protein [Paludibacteraceae bacterium]HOL29243.1 NAD-dependent epimerase/dehydratase family protein [Paludibacteraceae bacterium]HPQ12551.1 NAD-dependent epimerase/dehydratase family protein [Paludibacteraceae bacterium]HRT81376.1 NAD-dependent epimerase/dehydratase family protein [Bacteroidales bacterium]